MAAKKKEAVERVAMTVTLRPVPYFAFACDGIPGVFGVGQTPERALASMRAEVARRFPHSKYDIEETVLDR